MMIIPINKIKSKGVRKFPMTLTTLDGRIDRIKVTVKNKIEPQIGDRLGKAGSRPTSNVVAAVLGIAINGPIPSMMMIPNIVAI
ncbi:hypothetical protein D3C86_1645410 [compost metagenome]